MEETVLIMRLVIMSAHAWTEEVVLGVKRVRKEDFVLYFVADMGGISMSEPVPDVDSYS